MRFPRLTNRWVAPLWMALHSCVVHPMMGICNIISWGGWCPAWLVWVHDKTAELAWDNDPDQYHLCY